MLQSSDQADREPAETKANSVGDEPVLTKPPSRSRVPLLLGVGMLVALVVAVVFVSVKGAKNDAIENAAAECSVSGLVEDEGMSITFDTKGEDDFSGDEISDVACVFRSLEMPSRMINQIDATRALDGTQEASWDDFSARWRYHPDNGLGVTVWILEE